MLPVKSFSQSNQYFAATNNLLHPQIHFESHTFVRSKGNGLLSGGYPLLLAKEALIRGGLPRRFAYSFSEAPALLIGSVCRGFSSHANPTVGPEGLRSRS